MKKFQLFKYLVLLVFSLSACSDYNQFIEYNILQESFDFLQVFGPESKTVTIDPQSKATIHVSDSILLEIPEYAFVDVNRELVESELKVVFKVYQEIPSFVSNDFSFVLDDERLIGIQALFYINAFDIKGNPLFLNENKKILVKYPVSNAEREFDLFVPGSDQENELGNWIETTEDIINNKVFKEEWLWGNEQVSSGYLFQTDQLRWISLGYGISNEQGAFLEVENENGFNDVNSRVLVISNEHKSLHQLEWNEERHAFCDLNGVMPVGSNCKILFLAKNGDYYWGMKELVLEGENNIMIQTTKANESEIIDLIKTL